MDAVTDDVVNTLVVTVFEKLIWFAVILEMDRLPPGFRIEAAPRLNEDTVLASMYL